jgi:hypothetical protein
MKPEPTTPRSPALSARDQLLAAIRLPESLAGLKVLDVGCGDGYFCREAKLRGAAQVIGVDADPKHISAAEKQSVGLEIEFRHAEIVDLRDESFDIVLCLSAIHDTADPAALLQGIRHVLKPGGTLILEAGIVAGEELGSGRVLEAGRERSYPTFRLLREVWLRDYSFRVAGPGTAQAGDTVTWKIYHCTRERVSVVMIHGDGGIGKSSLARRLGPFPIVSTDALMRPGRAKNAVVAPAQAKLDAKIKEKRWLSIVWDDLRDDESVRTYCATVIADAIRQCRSAGTVIVEGHVLEDLGADIEARLGPDFRCWNMTRGVPTRRPGTR